MGARVRVNFPRLRQSKEKSHGSNLSTHSFLKLGGIFKENNICFGGETVMRSKALKNFYFLVEWK